MTDVLRILLKKETRDFISMLNKDFKQDKNYSFFNLCNTLKYLSKGNKLAVFNNKIISAFVIPPFPSKPFLTYINATKEKGNIYTQNALLQKTAPLTFSLGITNKCGYNCMSCSATGINVGEELSTAEWINVIKTLQDMGTAVITFTGGEPLLREDLIEIIRKVDDRSMNLLFTSAQGLTSQYA
jgi:uncharacterized radical SAM superfamily Fe-S cluster-containing enzyme